MTEMMCWLKEYREEVIRAIVMDEDEAWVGPERSVKTRFRELLKQHPKLTRPQAYMQAIIEVVGYRGYLVPPELAPGVLAQLETNDYNYTGPTITLPACVSREDCERITAEIQVVLDWAGLGGEQKALVKIAGSGG